MENTNEMFSVTEPPTLFTVEEPPAEAFTKSNTGKRGRANQNLIAFEFCAKNPNQWCKIFTGRYTDEVTKANAVTRRSQRKRNMKKFALVDGVVIEFVMYEDKALKTVSMFAKVLGESR